jgi:hypothetical protein
MVDNGAAPSKKAKDAADACDVDVGTAESRIAGESSSTAEDLANTMTVDAKPETNFDAKPETNFEAKPETNFEAKPETNFDAKPETTLDAKPETTFDSKPETDVEGTSNACAEEYEVSGNFAYSWLRRQL